MALKIVGGFGTYILFHKIGEGGMGTVWSGMWIGPGDTTKPVAIKEMHRLVTDQNRESFLEEARIMGRLNHSGIVSIFDVFELEGRLYLVMEWVDGVNLKTLLTKYGRAFDFGTCCYSLGELLEGVAHAHDLHVAGVPQAIIHYDIKLENIMISSSGKVKLTDFGISRFAATSERTLSQPIGTLRCMPPEQLLGRARIQSDIYCCGVVGVEMLQWPKKWRGDVPAEQMYQAVVSGHIPDLSGPDIKPWMVELLRSMLAADINLRPQADEARALIVQEQPWYQHGRDRLKDIYALVIGPKRSGGTDMYNFGLDAPEVEAKSLLRTPSSGLRSEPNVTPAEPTAVEPRHERAIEEDSPVVVRRNRVTPPAQEPEATHIAADRTSTNGPPMLDAIGLHARGPALILKPAPAALLARASEPPPVAFPEPLTENVEPTEVLPPVFTGDSAPISTPAHRPEAPAQETMQFAGGDPTPIADAPSASLALAPVSGPLRRPMAMGVVVGLGGAALALLGVVIGLAISKRPVDAEQQRPVADRVEVDGPGEDEQQSPPTSEAQPAASPAKPEPIEAPIETPIEEPGPVEPTEPEATPTADAGDVDAAATTSTKEAPSVEPVKPKKTKPKAKPDVTVVFMIVGGAPKAEIKVGNRTLNYNGYYARTKLRPGNKYPIEYRAGEESKWHSAGTLNVEEQAPGKYYEVHLTPSTIDPKIRQEGSAGK